MKRPRHLQFMSALRRDSGLFAFVSALLLLANFMHPLAEAKAAGKPFAAEICSAFGQPGKAPIPAMADDCPACIAGHQAAQPVLPADDQAFAVPQPGRLAGPADFASALTRIAAPGLWRMKPPGQGPPDSV